MKRRFEHTGYVALAAFASAFAFFQFAYPYHLMRREQLTLFAFDKSYIVQNYRGGGWLSRLAGDFLCQFFGLPVLGPVITALLLTATGCLTYRIVLRLLNLKSSGGRGRIVALAVAALAFLWSFLRETENLYVTRYTVVVLGYLGIVALCLKLITGAAAGWAKIAVPAISLVVGLWALGTPYNQYYGKLWGTPNMKYERMIALDVESYRENWDKVLDLSKTDLKLVESSYFYNLACAMKGALGENLLKHSQNHANTLFLWVTPDVSPFSNSIAGEVWYHLGDMTLAEQSAIIGLQATPEHTGVRFIERLARINLISGEYGASMKYLNLLSKTLFYRKTAKALNPDNHDESIAGWLCQERAKLAGRDLVTDRKTVREQLEGLLEANPDNIPALEYLLCYHLMNLDLNSFIERHNPSKLNSTLYQEATLIWLNLVNDNDISGVNLSDFGISKKVYDRLYLFYRNPDAYRKSYWYYYLSNMN